MEQIDKRLNIIRQQFVNDIVIKGHCFWIDLPASTGYQSGPGNREAECVMADCLHSLYIFFIAMIKIRRRFRSDIIKKSIGLGFIPVIPYIFAFAALMSSTFNLCGRRRTSPPETFRKFISQCQYYYHLSI